MIPNKRKQEKTYKYHISMEATDPIYGKVSMMSGTLDMEVGSISLNSLTQQAGLTSSKEILLVNNDFI